MKNRRGFTLIELLFGLFMMVIVAGGLYSLMVTVYRVTRKQSEVANVQGNLRAGMQLVRSELREIYTDAATGSSDINTLSGSAITYSSMRGFGESCGVTPAGGAVQVRQSGYSGRPPEAGRDRLLLFQDRDTLRTSDDVWLDKPITAVAAGTCTVLPATPSWDLTVPALLPDEVIDPVSGVDPWVFTPGPIRTAETMEMGLVTDAGRDWLGIRAVNAGEPDLIPVIGPLTPSGVSFQYFNGASTATGAAPEVKTILVTLRGITAQMVNTGLGSAVGSPTDSVIVRVHLRNSR